MRLTNGTQNKASVVGTLTSDHKTNKFKSNMQAQRCICNNQIKRLPNQARLIFD